MNNKAIDYDVVIIGAGPSGSVAATLLHNKGYRVHVVEKQQFPRFTIGESLLPQCMMFLEEAGMLDDVHAAAEELGFQYKNGAAFVRRDERSNFDFREKFSPGWGTTYQVQRAKFDHLLIQHAERKGVTVAWGHAITSADMSGDLPVLGAEDPEGKPYQLRARFVLDASGFARILPRMLGLDRPSNFPSRTSLFTHVHDNIAEGEEFDRNKIRITVHPEHTDVWYWMIPFGGNRTSTGVVARSEFYAGYPEDRVERLKAIIGEEPSQNHLLRNAEFVMPPREIAGYASDVSALWGKGFALLGNAGEFLDPVFSSGVTIAMKSASLSAAALDRQFRGEKVDWEEDFAIPLRKGVDCFRVFVEAWYDGRFQDIIFAPRQSVEVREMICSILAGYAWDENNPFVKDSARRMNTLAELCRSQ